MTLLNTINVGGTDFKVAGVAILGSCPTPAGSEVKVCTFTDDFELEAGDMLLVKFTYANTYGDGSTTYPKLQVNGTNYVMRRADGNYIAAGEWDNNATLTFLFDGTDFILPAGSGSAKGSGVPLGAILAIHSNQVPDGYLPCNGVQFDTAQFAALYALLGDDHTPDLREVTLVGIGQNATDTIATHDVYTLGQFKDDQLQEHKHNILDSLRFASNGASGSTLGIIAQSSGSNIETSNNTGRTGTTTHGKQKGVNYIIKATSGLPDDQQDYILNQLAPVDVVEEDNVHAVTSNAVAEAMNSLSSVLVSVAGHLGNMYLCKSGKVVFMSFNSDWTSLAAGDNPNLATIPQGYRPIARCGTKETTTVNATLYINEDGSVNCYNYGSAITQATNGNYFACWITRDQTIKGEGKMIKNGVTNEV